MPTCPWNGIGGLCGRYIVNIWKCNEVKRLFNVNQCIVNVNVSVIWYWRVVCGRHIVNVWKYNEKIFRISSARTKFIHKRKLWIMVTKFMNFKCWYLWSEKCARTRRINIQDKQCTNPSYRQTGNFKEGIYIFMKCGIDGHGILKQKL